jgi:hypothetical protein
MPLARNAMRRNIVLFSFRLERLERLELSRIFIQPQRNAFSESKWGG